MASELVIDKRGCTGNVLLHHYVVQALVHTSNELQLYDRKLVCLQHIQQFLTRYIPGRYLLIVSFQLDSKMSYLRSFFRASKPKS